MKKGLTRAGLGNVGQLETFVKMAHQYGFEAIDSSGEELRTFIADKGAEGANEFLQEHRMGIGSIGLSVEWRGSEDRFLADLERLPQAAKAAATMGCTSCCTYVLPSTDLNPAEFLSTATKRLRLCAQILGAYGVRLGLEYVGPHHLRTQWKYPFIWDLNGTLDWIDVIHEPNVGLNLDTIHWYTTGSNADELLQLTAKQVVHVHINDAPAGPVEEVLDNGRLYPGEGVIDIATFLGALKQIRYTGAVSQEILTQQPVTGSPDELLQKTANAFKRVFAEVGL